MNPTAMWGQVVAAILAGLLAGLSPAWPAVAGAGVLLGAWWLVLRTSYLAALGDRRRSDGRDEGPNRTALDHEVTAQSLLLVAVAIAVGGIGGLDKSTRVTESAATATCFAAIAMLFFAVFASSLVDWYYIRPRLDGVIREPPCRSSRDEAWMSVTRWWYLHRVIAELVGIFAIVVALTALLAALFAAGHPTVTVLISLGGAVLGLLVTWYRRAFRTLRDYVMDEPRLWLGDLLVDPADGSVSYLLHVTIKGLVVRDRYVDSDEWGRKRDLEFKEMIEKRFRARQFDGCRKCSMINKQCELKWTGRDAKQTS